MPVAPQPPPVFVDASGRRRRVLHVAALLVVLATVAGAIVLLVGVYAQPVDPAPLEVCPAAPTNPAARTNPAATTNPAARTNPAAASNPTVSVKRAGATVPVGGGSCARR
ncbi:hypothetical protein AB0M47_21975 [Hamadaea sp. NPDC051192]|uniref:hypothetical protein n=1 Tax=Hamadaea sp. NPDC051192 TaxID=3154940 RepID=UPI00342C0E6E